MISWLNVDSSEGKDPTRHIRTLVHGDDYVSSGLKKDLAWMEKKLSESYEIQTRDDDDYVPMMFRYPDDEECSEMVPVPPSQIGRAVTILMLRACTEMNGALARVQRVLDNGRYEVCMHGASVYPGEIKSLPLKNLFETNEEWSDSTGSAIYKKEDSFSAFSAVEKLLGKDASKRDLQEMINRKLFPQN